MNVRFFLNLPIFYYAIYYLLTHVIPFRVQPNTFLCNFNIDRFWKYEKYIVADVALLSRLLAFSFLV